ncbi:MAG: hypothetical protein ABMB14_35175 [Myxococcota bacterium]
MTRRLLVVGGACALILLAGIGPGSAQAGLFGSDAPGRIPVPAQVFRAEVEDVTGVVVAIDRVTFDGEVYLFGTVGKATVTVPFDRLVEVAVRTGPDEDHRIAVATTSDGATVEVVVEADRPLYGRAVFGNYRIEASDVRRVKLTP